MNRRQFLILGAGLAAGGCVGVGASRPGGPPWIVGCNTALGGYGLLQAVETVRDLGFRVIEIHPFGVPEPTPGQFPGFLFDQMVEVDRLALRRLLEAFDLVTTHLPFKQMSFFDANAEVQARCERTLEVAMEASAYFGARLAVLHVTPPRGKTLEAARPEILDRLRRWADRAKSAGFRIAIETGYPNSVDEYVRLIRDVGHDALGGCIDVGHQIGFRDFTAAFKGAARATPEGIRAYNDVIHGIIDGLQEKLIHFHVHDIDPTPFRDHRPIVYGVIDYPRLFAKLRRIGYRDLLMIEIEAGPAELAAAKRHLEDLMSRA